MKVESSPSESRGRMAPYMKPDRIYVDASVFGGCHDAEFARDSRRLLTEVRAGRFHVLISDLLVRELAPAPALVQAELRSLPAAVVEWVELTPEVDTLRDAYLAAQVVGPASRNDATHVAAASVARADAIVSWNFKHIVHFDKIKAYQRINLAHGYGLLTIVTPGGVITYGD